MQNMTISGLCTIWRSTHCTTSLSFITRSNDLKKIEYNCPITIFVTILPAINPLCTFWSMESYTAEEIFAANGCFISSNTSENNNNNREVAKERGRGRVEGREICASSVDVLLEQTKSQHTKENDTKL